MTMSPGDNSKALILDLAQKQLNAEARVAAAKNELETAESQFNELRMVLLPEALELTGSDTFSFKDEKTGVRVKVGMETKLRAGISKQVDPARAYDWLEQQGVGGAVKNEVVVIMDAGQTEKAKKLQEKLIAEGLQVDHRRNLHHTTLDKILRDKLEEGVDVPEDVFNIMRQRFSKVAID
jgi:hypothetical protein